MPKPPRARFRPRSAAAVTTTFTRLYPLAGGGALIGSPGFQEFGLYHLTEGRLERAFPEFRPLLADCRFYNCHHLHEPGCAILDAVADGRIAPSRHALYAQLVHEQPDRPLTARHARAAAAMRAGVHQQEPRCVSRHPISRRHSIGPTCFR